MSPLVPPSTAGRPTRLLGLLAGAALLSAAPAGADAGVLTRASLAHFFPDPLVVGEREKDLPVWPIFRQGGPPSFAEELAGYAFESIDLAPVPGFSGTPVNLLVALGANGEFLDVRVLSHHEPVFLGGIGEEPLVKFVTQYRGVSLKQGVKIGGRGGEARRAGSTNVYLDGVAKASASLRIINQSVLSAALKVARAKLGYAAGRDPELVAHIRPDVLEARTWDGLRASGLLKRLSLRNRDVEEAFAGSEAAAPEAGARPDDLFLELYAAVATVPTVGRNLLPEEGWRKMDARIDPGDQVLLVMSRGRYSFVGEDFVRNSVPDRLSLRQGGLAIEMRDLDLEVPLQAVGGPALDAWMAFRIPGHAGLDPGAPSQLAVRVTRSRGVVYPDRISRDFTLEVAVPERYLVPAGGDQKTWVAIWKARAGEIAVLLAALALLGWALARPSSLVADARLLRWFRPVFLVFTLGFIGWYAQGQLSVVNLVALLRATLAGRGWSFFLYDPMTALLWAFTLGSLLVWGRGTFCGWLCPFGALQELAAGAARLARVPRRRFGDVADRRLKAVKYAVLACIAVAAAVSARWSDALVEVEPFKTAITLHFARAAPFGAYAFALIAAAAVVEKPFCRYLCPLGAWLALAGRLRRLDWVPRRAECGKPCQTCRARCTYQAIARDGRIVYAECFQCMECVAVYRGDELCTTLAAARGKGPRPLPVLELTERSEAVE